MEPKFSSFEEQVFFTTLRIVRPATNSMGTGFLVEVPSCIEGKKYIFLVSNKHVLDTPTTETQLSFHLKDSKGKPLLGEVFNVNISEFKGGYYTHDLDDIDIALLNVSEFIDLAKTKTGKDVNCRCINLETFSNYEDEELVPSKQISFIGYPDNRYDKKNYLPILRGGVIASIPKVDFDGKPQVLVDAQVFQGSSGSPVFTIIAGTWKFIGVIFQTMIRNQEVQIIDTAQSMTTQEVLGIGLMIKSTAVMELVNKAKKHLDSINCP